MILTKLDKRSAHVLCSLLSTAIKNSLLQGVFPDDAKIALASPLDNKGISKKTGISNFKPVIILTTFSKIHEKVAKRSLEAGTNKSLSPFFSTLRKNYSTRHVLLCLVEKWRSVFMDLSKTFDYIPDDLLIAKLIHMVLTENWCIIFIHILKNESSVFA